MGRIIYQGVRTLLVVDEFQRGGVPRQLLLVHGTGGLKMNKDTVIAAIIADVLTFLMAIYIG